MMLQRLYFLLVLVFISIKVVGQTNHESSDKLVRFSDFWKGDKDATPAMLNMLKYVKQNNSQVIGIEPGEYHFYPEKAFEKYCYVPNHDNGLKRIAIPIIDMNNLLINAQGVRFVMHGLVLPFLIEKSENITIDGGIVDWELPLHSEAVVVANDEPNKTFDLKIPEEQPYLIRNGELVFVKEGFEHNLETAILFDKEKQRVLYNTKAYTPLNYKSKVQIENIEELPMGYEPFLAYPASMELGMQRKINAMEITQGIIRISGSNKQLPPVGSVFVCKGSGGISRLIPAVYLNQSTDVSIRSFSIYHAGGMGIIAEGCTNVALDKVNIGLEVGSKRMVSTTADATHFLNCRGKVSFTDCSFSNQLDDATNVHGAYLVVEDILSDKSVGVRIGHFQQQGLYLADNGDQIAFVNQEQSVNPMDVNQIQSVEKVNAGYYKLTFSESLPSQLKAGMMLENLDAYPEVSITNCRFFNNRARGILLSTPKKVLVENNYFSNMMSAVFMPVELSYWYESGHCQDVTIRNNTFEDSAYGGRNTAVIQIHTSLDKHDYVFGTIKIEGNTFKQYDAGILRANGIKALSFSDNIIESTTTYPPLYPENAAVEVKHIQELTVQKNAFGGIAVDKIEDEGVERKKIGKNKGVNEH